MAQTWIKKCREYSLPLIFGVLTALIFANIAPESYHHFLHTPIFGDKITFHFFVNDIFMVFFFAMAGVEIVASLSKGGNLNPINKAVTPLMATAGGVLGPIAIFFIMNILIGSPEWVNGWGIPTATDIALAWLVARFVFGKNHPAVSFLLLLAVADDGIGLVIIAVFYPDPYNPTRPLWLVLIVVAILLAYIFNRFIRVRNFWPYILICGTISWIGMYSAHLHPALALIFIIPFLPQKFTETLGHKDETYHDDYDETYGKSTLHQFEHTISPYVDFGLFFFGLSNAGVQFADMTNLTWIIMIALVVGKPLGISLFSLVSVKVLGFKLPDGMGGKEVFAAGVVAAMGLTVALFVAGVAYTDFALQGAAKMGALFTAFVSILALVTGKILKIKKIN